MSKWLLRGLAFAAFMVIVRLAQGAMINEWETKAGLISAVLIGVYGVAALVWGYVDGRADARANPDPDRRPDLAMTWLLAGLFAGGASGVVAWFVGLFYSDLYVEGLVNELSTFAAFTALLVFLTSVLGVAVGRWLVDRKTPDQPRRREGDDDRADTDVFPVVPDSRGVSGSESPSAGELEEQTSSVAVADDETTPVDKPDS
ncbi:MAG: B-4DMT family transporter [Actinomycetia bacterium]|nr:B-4DMT family transporter [Actinomycetes bacterium]MCH9701489.1 B-4DMT family transporter [Actinomycetes bacterium]MCH9760285.1 B-4DMT family transporter [Actinomycetes bacterium]